MNNVQFKDFIMIIVILVSFITIISYTFKKLELRGRLVSIVTIAIFVVASFAIGKLTGIGSVVRSPLQYFQQLSRWKEYTTLFIRKDGKSIIVLLQTGKHDFRTIRVKGKLPPTHFVLVDGKPVAVVTAAGKK